MRYLFAASFLATALVLGPRPPAPQLPPPPVPVVATYSIVARDPETGDLGVAVQSKFFGVGSVVPWAKAGVGAIATQAWANTTWGPHGLDLLGKGGAPAEVLRELTGSDPDAERRQIGIVDTRGVSVSFTGRKCQDWAGGRHGENYAVQGNILAGDTVVPAMEASWKASTGELADRLIAALEAAQANGGDRRGMQSAAVLVVRTKGGYGALNDRWVDLRVEDHPEPIRELRRLLEVHKTFFPRGR